MSNLTTIDWLEFRSQSEPMECLEALQAVFGSNGSLLRSTPRKGGWRGFQQSRTVSIGDMHIGLMGFGGESQRGWVSLAITGTGCAWVDDWDSCESELSRLDRCEKRRIDIALDTAKREVTHDKVVAAHRAGMFTTCGKPPSMSRIEPEDPYEGRTVYVGQRDQPKFLRAYEKGYEMARKHPGIELSYIDGKPIADMYRLELELKPKHQDLPGDLIECRDQYFAGAYPYLQSVLAVEPEIFKMSREKAPQRTLASMLGVLRTQYGNSLFTALAAHGGDVGAVWDKIVGDRHNENLLADGVLLVDHE